MYKMNDYKIATENILETLRLQLKISDDYIIFNNYNILEQYKDIFCNLCLYSDRVTFRLSIINNRLMNFLLADKKKKEKYWNAFINDVKEFLQEMDSDYLIQIQSIDIFYKNKVKEELDELKSYRELEKDIVIITAMTLSIISAFIPLVVIGAVTIPLIDRKIEKEYNTIKEFLDDFTKNLNELNLMDSMKELRRIFYSVYTTLYDADTFNNENDSELKNNIEDVINNIGDVQAITIRVRGMLQKCKY
jgi:hypothetical protein